MRFSARRIVARRDPFRHSAPVRWCVYLLRCGDGTLYAGMTNDLERRIAAHRNGRGARYTRGRGPLEVVHVERKRTRSSALKREAALKSLKREEKLALLSGMLLDSAVSRG
jgi:predicted GIY-YIG superfamily endonuclease